jgi:caffeoyl-CoA O-methyltransferase
MTRQTTPLSDELYKYLIDVSLRDQEVLRALREETAGLPDATMQIGPEQGQFMGLLVELIGARNVLEIGTYTGYSALVMALQLPDEGRIVACDVSEEWTRIAQRYWAQAGVADKIDLRLAPAVETLESLLSEGRAGTFDFVFIDADKTNYDVYYELALTLLRPGGLIAVDNTLWDGKVADEDVDDPDTEAIRAFNLAVYADARVSLSLVPLGDGLTLARKRLY